VTDTAVLRIGLQIPADAVTTISQPGSADALPLATCPADRTGVVAGAAVPVRFQDPAAGVAAGQVRRAFLSAAAAVAVVRGEIGTDATTATLPRFATDPIATIGVIWADVAVGATGVRIIRAVDAKSATDGAVL
jgi:hypothetical protein